MPQSQSEEENGAEFEVEAVSSASEVAELTRDGPRAEAIYRVLEETGGVYVEFISSWHGNEYLGRWIDGLFGYLKPDRYTEKAVFFENAVSMGFPLVKINDADRRADRRGYTEEELRDKYLWPAFHEWWKADDSRNDDDIYLTDEYFPKSGIRHAIRAESPTEHLLFTPDGKERAPLTEGELRIRGTQVDHWKHMVFDKFVVEGQTYEAFKECHLSDAMPFTDVEDDEGNVVEPGCYHSYNGTHQLLSQEGLSTAITWFNRAGFTVSVNERWEEFTEFDPDDAS